VADDPEHARPAGVGGPRSGVSRHDGLFRLVFGQPVHAASELQAVLPAALTARLDLERLTAVNGSFVDAELRWRHSDVLGFRFLLDDLAGTDPSELRAVLQARPLTPAALVSLFVLQVAPRSADVARELEQVLDTLQEALHSPGGTEVLRAIVTYIHGVAETPADRLRQVMARLGPEAEEVYVTTADMLRAEGEAKGRAEALTQLLTLKFGALPEDARTKLRTASTQQLAEWTARVLDAPTLDEVFT
jgi:hypothetical protein